MRSFSQMHGVESRRQGALFQGFRNKTYGLKDGQLRGL